MALVVVMLVCAFAVAWLEPSVLDWIEVQCRARRAYITKGREARQEILESWRADRRRLRGNAV